MRLYFILFPILFPCISFQETRISPSLSGPEHCEGTAINLIEMAKSLPKGASIRLPITIQQMNPLGGLTATLGEQPIELIDMTSMGLSTFENVTDGQTVWMDGQWGTIIDQPDLNGAQVSRFSVVAVGDTVPANTPLTLMRLNGKLNCATP